MGQKLLEQPNLQLWVNLGHYSCEIFEFHGIHLGFLSLKLRLESKAGPKSSHGTHIAGTVGTGRKVSGTVPVFWTLRYRPNFQICRPLASTSRDKNLWDWASPTGSPVSCPFLFKGEFRNLNPSKIFNNQL